MTAAEGLLLLAVALPLLALPWAGQRGRWRALVTAGPALPAMIAALTVPSGTTVELPWLLLGGALHLDTTGRPFLLLAGILWTVAGVHAAGSVTQRLGRFDAAWLVVMGGNFLVATTTDPVLFVTGFAMVGLLGYPLVVHADTAAAHRAGNRYLVLAMIGEALVFGGLVGAQTAGAVLPPAWAVATVIVGFGIKAGLLPLHVWLPLAHPVAPTPASAVLSGTLIKAGLLGWLRFLPLGEAAYPAAGGTLVALGLAGAFLAAAAGIVQNRAKVVLAYSSISQMGWLILAVGLGLLAPQAWPALAPAVALFALHHGLAKGALFLAAGSGPKVGPGPGRLLAAAGLLLPAAALTGLPLTTGGAAKDALKGAAYGATGLPIGTWLAWGSAATTLITARAVYLAWPRGGGEGLRPAERWGWGLGVVAGLAAAWAWPPFRTAGQHLLQSGHALAATAPIAAALGAAVLGGWLLAGRRVTRVPLLPPGDLLVPVEAALRWLGPTLATLRPPPGRWQAVHARGHGKFVLRARFWLPRLNWRSVSGNPAPAGAGELGVASSRRWIGSASGTI